MKKLICKIFGHKNFKIKKTKNGIVSHGSFGCFRCGYNPIEKQLLYFSGGIDLESWGEPHFLKIYKKDIRGNLNLKIKKNKIYKDDSPPTIQRGRQGGTK